MSDKLYTDAEKEACRLERGARTRAEELRKAITDYLSGDFASARSYRPGECPHGVIWFHECEACNDAYFQKAIDADDAWLSKAQSGTEP